MNDTKSDKQLQPYRILSLDGGGIRGLITSVWLQRLEQELGSPLKDHFDLIAGTSTGSILACGISLGKTPSDLIKIYKERGKEIFPNSLFSKTGKFIKHFPTRGLNQQFYTDKGLKKVLKEEFSDTSFGELWSSNNKKITTVVTSYDTLNRRAFVFNSSQERYNKIPVWEICKASSSAPMYFPPHIMTIYNGVVPSYKIPMIDGGVVASNPTACALAEGIKIIKDEDKKNNKNSKYPDLGRFIVVSLGSGDASRSISVEKVKKWGIFNWTLNITNVLFDGVSQSVDHITNCILNDDENDIEHNNYFRFQAKLETDSLDDTSDENINALQAFANLYLEDSLCKRKIKVLKEKLKKDVKSKVEEQAGQTHVNTDKMVSKDVIE